MSRMNAQDKIMAWLARHPGATLLDVKRKCGVTPTTTAERLFRALVEDGLVVRREQGGWEPSRLWRSRQD